MSLPLLLLAAVDSYAQAQLAERIKSLRLKPATLGYADEEEVTPGCVGELVLGYEFTFEDPEDCWPGVEIDTPLQNIESIYYEVWDSGTSLTIRIKAIKRPLLIGVTTIRALKAYRHIHKYSPNTKQRCALGWVNAHFEESVATISCESWAEQ